MKDRAKEFVRVVEYRIERVGPDASILIYALGDDGNLYERTRRGWMSMGIPADPNELIKLSDLLKEDESKRTS